MTNIAIFASGSGSNAENTVKHFANCVKINIGCILTNKADAYVLERAKRLDVEAYVFSNDDFKTGDKVLKFLLEKQIDFIVLAGFLLKIPHNIVASYPNRIVNIHPALLPKFGGKGMYGDNVHKAVVNAKEKESGITIHYINENYDEGNIIFQATCAITPADSYENVAHKVHSLEYEHFPLIIEKVIEDIFGE